MKYQARPMTQGYCLNNLIVFLGMAANHVFYIILASIVLL